MASAKVVNNSATKSFGTQTSKKSTDSFSVDASAIPVTLTGSISSAKNVKAALEALDNRTAAQSAAPSSPTEGDVWYDTDDDKF